MLIIVESPAKAKTIKSFVGKEYTVEASIGHIRVLSDEKKTEDGRKLKFGGIDIENNFRPIYEIDEKKADVVSKLRKLAKDEKEILFATDSDREGEAISWHLAEVLGIQDITKLKRLEFHEITKPAIQEALNHPRPLRVSLVKAQQARQVLDKLVGYSLSPVLWDAMGNRNLSAGRVQSPALVLVCKREKEIEAFKPEEYLNVFGNFSLTQSQTSWIEIAANTAQRPQELQFSLVQTPFGKEPFQGVDKEKIRNEIERDPQFTLLQKEEKTQNIRPKPPFTTSTLQQAASSRLGMAPRTTMSLAQKLYEGLEIHGEMVGLITYMRTDSTFVSAVALNQIRSFLQQKFADVVSSEPRLYSKKSKNAQEAHEAIRPTNILLTPENLEGKIDSRMHKLYTLIWNRTVASQCRDEVRHLTMYTLSNSSGYHFRYTLTHILDKGYTVFQKAGGKKDVVNPIIPEENTVYYLKDGQMWQKYTEPPSRYSPASLIKKLEELGIGRPSTYATIISTLYERKYVEENQKSLIPTTLGKRIADILIENFEEVAGTEMTKHMEDGLDRISEGQETYEKLLSDFWSTFEKEVAEKHKYIAEKRSHYRKIEGATIPDPSGKGNLVLKIGRFGEYWQNETDPSIMYPKNFREYQTALKQAQELYSEKVQNLVSPVSKEPLVVRVSKSSLNPYIATANYIVGGKEKALNIKLLDEKGWTQKTVNELYAKEPTGTRKWSKKRRFLQKRKK